MRPCPFCGTSVEAGACRYCKRDPTAARRVCGQCTKMTPVAEAPCCHCGARAGSELAWKVPVIIAMFALAVVVSVALAMVR